METLYIEELSTVFIKPVGYVKTRKQVDDLVLDFEKIHEKYHGKLWLISDITEFMFSGLSLLKYFAGKMTRMDEKRYGTVFILQDFVRKTGVNLLKHYTKANFYITRDLESAIEIIKTEDIEIGNNSY